MRKDGDRRGYNISPGGLNSAAPDITLAFPNLGLSRGQVPSFPIDSL